MFFLILLFLLAPSFSRAMISCAEIADVMKEREVCRALVNLQKKIFIKKEGVSYEILSNDILGFDIHGALLLNSLPVFIQESEEKYRRVKCFEKCDKVNIEGLGNNFRIKTYLKNKLVDTVRISKTLNELKVGNESLYVYLVKNPRNAKRRTK